MQFEQNVNQFGLLQYIWWLNYIVTIMQWAITTMCCTMQTHGRQKGCQWLPMITGKHNIQNAWIGHHMLQANFIVHLTFCSIDQFQFSFHLTNLCHPCLPLPLPIFSISLCLPNFVSTFLALHTPNAICDLLESSVYEVLANFITNGIIL